MEIRKINNFTILVNISIFILTKICSYLLERILTDVKQLCFTTASRSDGQLDMGSTRENEDDPNGPSSLVVSITGTKEIKIFQTINA